MTKNEILYCSFCARARSEVKILIAGREDTHICENCAEHAREIVAQELPKNNESAKKLEGEFKLDDILENIKSPRFIYDKISEYAVGMEMAKKVLSVAVYNHYNRLFYSGETMLDKSNILIIGPTGSGKTHIIKTISKCFEIPISISNATALTEAGYVGLDVEHVLFHLYRATNKDKSKTENGIIYIDEIDKIAKKDQNQSLTRDVSGEGVQQALLPLLENSEIDIPPNGGRKHPEEYLVKINTGNILFICGGAFYGLERIVLERLIRYGILKKEQLDGRILDYDEIRKYVVFEDLITYGLIPEFIGRFNYLIVIDNHSKVLLKKILIEPKNSILVQYKNYFEKLGVELVFEEDAIDSIVELSITKYGSGARALKSVVSKIFIETMFEIANIKDLKKCIINKKVVSENKSPIYINNEGHIVSISNGELFVRDKIFMSYSRDDEYWLKEVEKMMSPLLRNNSVSIWFDGKIKPSQKWREEIERALSQSKIALLFVSPSFINSQICNGRRNSIFFKDGGKE